MAQQTFTRRWTIPGWRRVHYAPVAFRFQSYGFPLAAVECAYAERLLALPSMQVWYTDALAEP